MQFLYIVVGLIGLVTLAVTAPTTSSNGLPYPIEVVQYTGSLGGYEVQLNGTVQEMFAQMQILHPDFNPNSPGFALAVEDKNLASRDALNKDGELCCPVAGQDWTYAQAWAIQDGVTYLNALDRLHQNAKSCGRISCSYSSAIYLCNDNDYGIDPAAKYLATYATDLMDGCSQYPPGWIQLTCGQEFDTDHYNIIVREDSC